jgi:hypothetical protein
MHATGPKRPRGPAAAPGGAVRAVLAALLAAAAVPAGAAPPQAPEPPAAGAARAEPAIDRRVVEDDGVRIEELRVRGLPVRISVQSKVKGARPYEIHPGHGGRDASQDRGVAGTSGWRLLSF